MNALQTSAREPATRSAKIRAVVLSQLGRFTAGQVLTQVLELYPNDRFSMNLVCVVVNELMHREQIEWVAIAGAGRMRMRIYQVSEHGAE